MRIRFFLVVLLSAVLGPLAAPAQTPPKLIPEVPYVPSSTAVVEAMLRLAGVTSSDNVYDLGCGDGRIVILAAKRYKAHGVGIDINPQRIQEARANAKAALVGPRVRFEENDLFDADIHDATVVTLYLLPHVNMRLRPKLLKELKPGTRIVSHSFDMEDWKPDKEEEVDGHTIYLWTVPAAK
jgi:cyclopropane fatty-acyl-phospholipid synthase-like methyltransferase